MSAVEPGRAGLASGVNNTARQAGGAIGIAVYGAVAGPAARTDSFVHGLRVMSGATVGLFLLAMLVTLAFVRSVPDDGYFA